MVCSAEWGSGTIQRIDDPSSAFLICRAQISDALLKQISSGISKASEIVVKGKDGSRKAVVYFQLRSNPIARIVPCTIPIGGYTATTSVKISNNSSDQWQLRSISTANTKSIEIAFSRKSTDLWEVSVSRHNLEQREMVEVQCHFANQNSSIAPFDLPLLVEMR